jgi:hypothetical protein
MIFSKHNFRIPPLQRDMVSLPQQEAAPAEDRIFGTFGIYRSFNIHYRICWKKTTVEKWRSGFLLNPTVFFMSLFSSHNLIYDNILVMKIKK